MLSEQKRKAYIRRIHIQKARAFLDDGTYKTILFNTVGFESCNDLTTEKQFEDVVIALNHALITQGQPPVLAADEPYVSGQIYALKTRARLILGDSFEQRLNGFTRKMCKKTYKELNDWQIRRAHAFLTSCTKRKK